MYNTNVLLGAKPHYTTEILIYFEEISHMLSAVGT